ncbi:hypothetical protein [Micromonospora sp. IBHARD004]|uniref:hypothetical protein n=1 Tax=Micromonospora sp. IBHARD004 TaxID=3457764 RepID=UPI004057FADA
MNDEVGTTPANDVSERPRMTPGILILMITVGAVVALILAGRARWVLYAGGLLLAAYLIARAIAEPFVIDMSDGATYRNDWGGPHLAGVLAVHCGPGLLAALLIGWLVSRRVMSGRTGGGQAKPL